MGNLGTIDVHMQTSHRLYMHLRGCTPISGKPCLCTYLREVELNTPKNPSARETYSRILFVLSGKHQFVYHFLKMNQNRKPRKTNKRKKRSLTIAPDLRPMYRTNLSDLTNQYVAMATPAFSGISALNTLTSTVRLSAQEVDFSKMTLEVQTTTLEDLVTRYRLLVFHIPNRWAYDANVDPNLFVTATVTVANFMGKGLRVPRDQSVPYRTICDRVVVQDTHAGHDPLKMLHRIKVPRHRVLYDPDDATGVTAMGQYFFAILTEGTAASADYTWDLWAQVRYRLRI
jgi:hypothetical protein